MDIALVQPHLYLTLSKSAEEYMRLIKLEQEEADKLSSNKQTN